MEKNIKKYKKKEDVALSNNEIIQMMSANSVLQEFIYNILYRIPCMYLFYELCFGTTDYKSHMIYFLATYIQEQIMFMIGHISLHTYFIYAEPTLDSMGLFCLMGYIHHYYNPLLFSQINFFSYCNAYIEGIHNSTSFIYQYKSIKKNIVICITLPLLYFLSFNYKIAGLLALLQYIGLERSFVWLLIACFMKSQNINNTTILTYTCYQILQIYLQAITHLWYHTLHSKRRSQLGFGLYNTMLFLEKINIVSSEEHKLHHKHQIETMDEAELWYDLHMPAIVNKQADKLWKYILTLKSNHTSHYTLISGILQMTMFFIITSSVIFYIHQV